MKYYIGARYYNRVMRKQNWGKYFWKPEIQWQGLGWEWGCSLFGLTIWFGRKAT